MAYKHKDNNGSLFVNDKKEKDSQPDYTGSINIAGKLYRISAWDNKAQTGKKYFGLKISEFEDKPKAKSISNEDLPF